MSRNQVTIEDRFRYGEFTIAELRQLKAVGLTRVYEDIKAGRLPVLKRGRATRIAGPVALAYVPGVGVKGEEAAEQ